MSQPDFFWKRLEPYLTTGIAQHLPDYHYRPEQLHLAQAITETLEADEFLVAEIGTGVGKTYAYLIPAVLWAIEQKERVVISTRTKALQSQLLKKDILGVEKIIGQKFNCAEAKGRENYLCWNKYIKILGGRVALDYEEQGFITAILKWAEQTETGDREEIRINSNWNRHWPLIGADRYSCAREQCRYQDRCFRLKMLRRLEKASIIVTNHSLLLSDLAAGKNVLPNFDHLIIDEAHSFEKECFDKLSCRVFLKDIEEILNFLQPAESFKRGWLASIIAACPDLKEPGENALVLVRQMMEHTLAVFAHLQDMIAVNNERAFVVIWEECSSDKIEKLLNMYQQWQDTINLLIRIMNDKIRPGLKTDDELEMSAILNRLQELSDNLFLLLEEDMNSSNKITWMEVNPDRTVRLIASSSLDSGGILSQILYGELRSLVMVSATITVQKSFDYFLSKTGLIEHNDRVRTLREESPFDYKRQACLYLVNDLAGPVNSAQFVQEVGKFLLHLAAISPGRVMVLFTATAQMLQVSSYLRPLLRNTSTRLLAQYEDGEYGSVLEKFKENPNSMLLGVDTFWEGIDLKRDLLSCLVIVKLPFRSPADPYARAGVQFAQIQEKNGFLEFMLPDAVVKFKQGIGRLIRSELDYGCAVVLDNRLITKTYGQVFRSSIPIENIINDSQSRIIGDIRSYLSHSVQ